jgi:hypothetical protein
VAGGAAAAGRAFDPNPQPEAVVFDWLFEGRASVYVFLAALAAVMLYAWWVTRKRRWLYRVGAVAVLAGAYFLLDRLVETSREQIERNLTEMAAGVKARDRDRVFNHLSDDFRWRKFDKSTLRVLADSHGWQLGEPILWDIRFPSDYKSPVLAKVPGEGQAPPSRWVVFRLKRKGDAVAFDCEALFVREPDGQWRMRHFEVFNPVVDSTKPLDLPGLP